MAGEPQSSNDRETNQDQEASTSTRPVSASLRPQHEEKPVVEESTTATTTVNIKSDQSSSNNNKAASHHSHPQHDPPSARAAVAATGAGVESSNSFSETYTKSPEDHHPSRNQNNPNSGNNNNNNNNNNMDPQLYDQLDLNEELDASMLFEEPPRSPKAGPPPSEERRRRSPLQSSTSHLPSHPSASGSTSSSAYYPPPPPSYSSHHHSSSSYLPHHSSRDGGGGGSGSSISSHYRRASPPSTHKHGGGGRYPPSSSSSSYPPPSASPKDRSGYYPPPPGYSSSYYGYHPEQWEGYYAQPPPGPFPEEDGIPVPPPSSKKSRREHDLDVSRTPEKVPARSPFQSPEASKKGGGSFFRRSPPPFQPSPGPFFGATGSFGMLDTPSQTLQDFSPMGPQYANNGEFTLDDSSTLLPYNASNPAFLDLQDSPRRSKPEGSPLTEFMTSPSPFDMKLHNTIMSSSSSSSKSPLVLQSVEKATAAVTHSNSNKRHHIDPSGKPEPRKLWPKEDGPPTGGSTGSRSSANSGGGAVRLEIGGAGSLSTRNKMDSINTMVQSTPSRRPGGGYGMHPPPPPPPPSGYHPSMQHYGYRDDMTTPNKGHYRPPGPPPPRMYPPMPLSSSKKDRYSPHPGSTSKPGYLPPRDSKVPPPPPPSYLRPSPPNSSRKTPSPSTGKENIISGKKGAPGAPTKRSPCNCKRSKCLKLYCECFAAERYCEGCNCADCGNTPNAGPARDKAIKETRAKNANAFKEKFGKNHRAVGHNMGCRCKKSACLKKYCECFQAGALCGAKCKCAECLNYAGSQALIDKRRKIKDQRGADFAMRVADEAWKGKPPPGVPLSARKGHPLPNSGRRHPTPSPMGAGRLPHHLMHSTPRGPPHHPHHAPPHYMGPPMMMGYPPMGMPMTPASGYHPHHAETHGMYPPPPGPPPSSSRKMGGKGMVTPASLTAVPKSPPVRIKFDPATSRKKRNTKSGEPEPTLPYFGKTKPDQPKTTALAIFAFLSNDEIYNAGLVCKSWSRLAVDEELWKIQS